LRAFERGDKIDGTEWPTTSMPGLREKQPQADTRKCGIQPADKSLQTVVLRSCLLHCALATLCRTSY
jgi:hypothetical protein